MKYLFIVLLVGAIVCGCSKKQTPTARPAADLIIAGRDVGWHDGSVLHVTKRDGDSIEGIRLVTSTGATITADKGTIKRGQGQLVGRDHAIISTNFVTLTFEEAHVQNDTTNEAIKSLKLLLYP